MTRILATASIALLLTCGAAQAAPSLVERVCPRVQAAVASLGVEGAIAEALRRGYRMGTINRWRRICGV